MPNPYPTVEQVAGASQQQLLSWSRYLPSPDDTQRPVLDAILARQAVLRDQDPAGFTAASKSVGWH